MKVLVPQILHLHQEHRMDTFYFAKAVCATWYRIIYEPLIQCQLTNKYRFQFCSLQHFDHHVRTNIF